MAARVLSNLLVAVAHVLSPVVYSGYEVLVRVINRAPRPIPSTLANVLAPYFTDIDLALVGLVVGARIPSGHAGLTLGRTIFVAGQLSADDTGDVALLVHELVHVRQRFRLGRVTMMRRYGVEWARVLSYRDHPMEIEARNYEAWVTASLRSLNQDGQQAGTRQAGNQRQ